MPALGHKHYCRGNQKYACYYNPVYLPPSFEDHLKMLVRCLAHYTTGNFPPLLSELRVLQQVSARVVLNH